MSGLDQKFAQHEFQEYEKNPVESAKSEVKAMFESSRPEIDREISLFSASLEGKFKNPLTPEFQKVKSELETIVKEDKASLAWIDGKAGDKETMLLVASRTDRFANSFLDLAKGGFGGDRVLGQPEEGTMTKQENAWVELAGRLFYSADVIRNSLTNESTE